MKAAIYCRLSEEDRQKPEKTADSLSIQNQKSMLLQYALEQGWEIYRIYSDDDYTGSDRNRPEFNRLLEDAKNHCFDIVLCKTQSRFTRELELVEKYIHGLFPLWGIRFVSIVDHADTADKANKKSRQINGLVNEWYLEDMSENIRSVLTDRRKNGFHIGSFALYGYQKDPNQKGHLIIDEEAAAVVREVFALFARGYGKTAIARLLNARGIPNPTEYKRRKGLRYQQPKGMNSTLWNYSSISDMLANEIYIGNMVQGKYGSVSYKTGKNRPRPKSEWYIVTGTHEAIIDRKLWDNVQALRLQRSRPFASGTIGVFTGKTRCAYCGYTLRSSKSHGRHYLQCPTRRISPDACTGSFISVDKLEQMILEELERLNEKYLDKDRLLQNISPPNDLAAQKQKLLWNLSDLKKQILEYQQAIGVLYMDHIKGRISKKDFIELKKDFTEKKEQLEHTLPDMENQLEELEKRMISDDDGQEWLKRYLHPEHLSREMVEILIDCIIVGKRIPGTRTIPIEIHWNF